MIKAISIQPDGTVDQIELADFDAIRKSIDGYVEGIECRDGAIFWCNEDGGPLGLAANGLATALWWRLDPTAPRHTRLVGPVIITGDMGDDDDAADDEIADVPTDIAELMAAYQK